jgi:hypothetical protein
MWAEVEHGEEGVRLGKNVNLGEGWEQRALETPFVRYDASEGLLREGLISEFKIPEIIGSLNIAYIYLDLLTSLSRQIQINWENTINLSQEPASKLDESMNPLLFFGRRDDSCDARAVKFFCSFGRPRTRRLNLFLVN